MSIRTVALLILSGLCFGAGRQTENVVLVMTDGLRRQEIFQGADPTLLNKEHGNVADVEALKKRFWREDTHARREALMPFFWTVLARKGQIFGNPKLESDAHVTNGLNFSYPGYNETLSGYADPRINSNDKIPNPNVTVLEWLHSKPQFRSKVAVFGAWDVISFIANASRAGFVSNSGYDPLTALPGNGRVDLLNRLKSETRYWEVEPFDAFPFHTALEYLKAKRPRVLFLSLGETDEWAHSGNYDKYLYSANRVDSFLKELWTTLQSIESYRDKTTLIFLPDHGRGEAPVEWRNHGQKVPDSMYIWMGFLGPDTPPLGERSRVSPVTQNQIAATIAALLREDYTAFQPKAGKPITEVINRQH